MVRGPFGREKGVHYEEVRVQLSDPYLPKKGWKEPTICPKCLTVYHQKRWIRDEKLLLALKKHKKIEYHKCPACRKIEDGYAMGIILLSGSFVVDHQEELLNLLQAEEKRAQEKNPLERLIKIEKKNGGIYAETTSDALALRIGRLLRRAYKGDHRYNFRYGDKFVEIEWHRD